MASSSKTARKPAKYIAKEISWLLFNERVLQEATDERNPLVERLKFMGIFSSNLDEFYRVRVANLQRLLREEGQGHTVLGISVERTLKEIREIVLRQGVRFNTTFRNLNHELEEEGIHIVDEKHLDEKQEEFVRDYFQTKVRPSLVPILLHRGRELPVLKDRSIYLAAEIVSDYPGILPYALVEVPSDSMSRFVILPRQKDQDYVILMEDVIRLCLPEIFALFQPRRVRAWTIKVTRDSELELDPEVSENYLKRVHLGLKKRREGDPVRMVYDKGLPAEFLRFLVRKMEIGKEEDIIPGQRYHNIKDFIKFPALGRSHLVAPVDAPISHPRLKKSAGVLEAVAKHDILLQYPYHSFTSFLDLLREAAIDPHVAQIRLTVYRVTETSSVLNALSNAARNGKRVTVLMEILARFDEENNILWANRLREVGVDVIIGVRGLKVHSKLCLISRHEGRKLAHYACIGTGNFNEDTARLYTDHILLTKDPRITSEVMGVFEFFQNNYRVPDFHQLIVSPFQPRKAWKKLLQQEIRNVRMGKEAFFWAKLNNLADEEMMDALYEAAKAGVQIRMIVRGMNSMIPGVVGLSENIEMTSIVGRYLEHSRFLIFANGGDPCYYITSGDWMARNFDSRVEVACPIRDRELKGQLHDYFELQWEDTANTRLWDAQGGNRYRTVPSDEPEKNCHEEIRAWLARMANEG